MRNEKYVGDVLLQKTFVEDLFSGKQVKNQGELERFFMQEHHPAIVSRGLYERVNPDYILNEAYYRHIFFSLVADFCSYMLESINCAAKMKVAVSYALLRKPLKDTLGYIVNDSRFSNIFIEKRESSFYESLANTGFFFFKPPASNFRNF